MRFFAALLLSLTACSIDGPLAEAPEPPPTPTSSVVFEFEFDPDQWTGEVEWELVEECALLGLTECAPRIERMRVGECNVASTRLVLESLSSNAPQEHARRVSQVLEQGDCQLLDEDDWVLSTR